MKVFDIVLNPICSVRSDSIFKILKILAATRIIRPHLSGSLAKRIQSHSFLSFERRVNAHLIPRPHQTCFRHVPRSFKFFYHLCYLGMRPWTINDFWHRWVLLPCKDRASISPQPRQSGGQQAKSFARTGWAFKKGILLGLACLNNFRHIVSLALVRFIRKVNIMVLNLDHPLFFYQLFLQINMLKVLPPRLCGFKVSGCKISLVDVPGCLYSLSVPRVNDDFWLLFFATKHIIRFILFWKPPKLRVVLLLRIEFLIFFTIFLLGSDFGPWGFGLDLLRLYFLAVWVRISA